MSSLKIITLSLILAGGVIMFCAIINSRYILQLSRYFNNRNWKILISLMIFFLLGYFISAFAVFTGMEKNLVFITGVIFFFGSLFVFIVTRTSYITIRDFSVATEKLTHEIKERQQLEDALNKAQNELESRIQERTAELIRSNKELESFSYTVSHDLRAPLRAIHGYTKILSEDYFSKLDDDAKKMMSSVMHNSQKMGQLIDDLLTFTRLGKNEPQTTETDMNQLTDNVITEINKNIKHKAKIITHTLPKIQSDSDLMRQAMYNLLNNAVKFSSKKENPVVEIGSLKKNGHDIFYVKDNGAGFDMKYCDKLFGVFHRLHSAEEYEGTGVGLAIVQKIITKQGGKVWAEGKVNEGATFYFSLNGNKKH